MSPWIQTFFFLSEAIIYIFETVFILFSSILCIVFSLELPLLLPSVSGDLSADCLELSMFLWMRSADTLVRSRRCLGRNLAGSVGDPQISPNCARLLSEVEGGLSEWESSGRAPLSACRSHFSPFLVDSACLGPTWSL